MGIRAINRCKDGVNHGNPADSQVEKSGSPPTILRVRMVLVQDVYLIHDTCRRRMTEQHANFLSGPGAGPC